MIDSGQIPAAFAECWNRHEMEAFAELFELDAHFVNVFGTHWRGREEIEAAHRATHSTVFSRSHLTIGAVDRIELSHDGAVQYAQWTLDGLFAPDGNAMSPRQGILLFVSRRQGDGTWRIAAAQNTDITTPPS